MAGSWLSPYSSLRQKFWALLDEKIALAFSKEPVK